MHCNDDFQLQVSAVVCGTVEAVGRGAPTHPRFDGWKSIILEWREIFDAATSSTENCSEEELRKIFIDVIMAGGFREYFGDPEKRYFQSIESLLRLYDGELGSVNNTAFLLGRAFLTVEADTSTHTGQMFGMGPSKALPGKNKSA